MCMTEKCAIGTELFDTDVYAPVKLCGLRSSWGRWGQGWCGRHDSLSEPPGCVAVTSNGFDSYKLSKLTARKFQTVVMVPTLRLVL